MNPDTTDEFFHSQNAHKTSDFKRKKYSDFPKKNLKLYSKPKGDQQSQKLVCFYKKKFFVFKF